MRGMDITRRAALAAALGAPLALAQFPTNADVPNKIGIGYTVESNGTRITVLGEEGAWFVAILESGEDADAASVDVFYQTQAQIDGKLFSALLHKNSPCPVVPGAMCMADFNFSVPLEDVRMIRVTLMKTVAKREFR